MIIYVTTIDISKNILSYIIYHIGTKSQVYIYVFPQRRSCCDCKYDTIQYMSYKYINTIFISLSILFFGFIAYSFTDTGFSPNSNNKKPPVDNSISNQEKNAGLFVKKIAIGTVGTRIISINNVGNVGVSASVLNDVRVNVKGNVRSRDLSGSNFQPLCVGTSNGSSTDGYPIVKCQ